MPAKKAAAKQAKRQKQAPEPTELLITELRDIYSAENQLTRTLPRLSKSIENASVRQLMDRRLEQAQQLIQDIDAVFEELDTSPGRKKNVAAEGLLADALEHLQEIPKGPALDAVLIGAVQKLEHYCIAAWGTARAFAQALEVETAVRAMDRALEDGRALDEELTQIAEEEVNPEMVAMGGEEEMEDEDMGEATRRGGKSGGGGEARQ